MLGRQTRRSLRRRKEDVSPGAGNPASANRCDWCSDEADHVVDRVARLDVATRRRDEHSDRRVRVSRQCEQAAANCLCEGVVDFTEDQNKTRLEGQLLFESVALFGLDRLVVRVAKRVFHGLLLR